MSGEGLFDWEFFQRYAAVVALLLTIPLFVLAGWRRIYPNLNLVLACGVPCVLSLLVFWTDDAALLALTADVVLLGVAIADLLTLPRPRTFSAERDVGRIASLGTRHPVTLRLNSESTRTELVELRDDIPAEFVAEPLDFQVPLAPRSRSSLQYALIAQRRGAFQLRTVHLRARSRLSLWKRHIELPVASTIHVYPDMKQLSEYALLARTNRLTLIGVRRTRRVGQDNEFERLRDYTPDDNYKHIDWRSTARRQRLTVKDFQSSQSQRVIFLVDCGRMMTNEADGRQLLDHALNAMLMMSHVALRQGDSAGLICFSDQVHTYVPPRGGMHQLNALLHAAFDRFPRLVESRYDEAFLYLASRCKKRSLVVLITNIVDEVNSMQVEQYLGALTGRHLPVGVVLRDRRLFEAADQQRPTGAELYRAAAAADILAWRHQVLRDMEHRGIRIVDADPRDLTAGMINQYLEIKARHLL